MSKPINRKEQKHRYQLIGIGSYLLIVYATCHIGHVLQGQELSMDLLIAGIDHCLEQPFNMFPTDTAMVGKAMIFGILAPLLIYSEYLRKRDLRPAVEHGSAKWNEDLTEFYKTYTEMTSWPEIFNRYKSLRTIKRFCLRLGEIMEKIPLIRGIHKRITNKLAERFGHPENITGSKNMIFTALIFMSMNTRKTRRNNNVLVIGGSGTGKSRFVVKPNMLMANSSFIITDPSGELLETMGVFLENEGYEVRVFNLVEMEHSNCYNPFHYIRNQEGVLIMINALIKNTTPKGSSSSDPFWEKAETALLQAICFFLVSECNEEDQNFSNVMKLLRCAKAVEGQENVDSTLDVMFKDLAAKDPEHIAVQSYAVFKSAGGGKTAQSILISCQTRLQTFNLDAIKKLTSTDDIDLGSVGDKKVALFCITPSADTTFNYLIALMYTQLFETLYHHAETQCEGKRLPHHVRFLLDEFANVGTIPDFPQKLATMRKYEISCTIIIQALSQLKAMYRDDWEVLVGNCDSRLFLGGADATTLEYVSKTLGKETIRSVNTSRSYGRQGSSSLSYNKTGRELMTPEELSVMDNNNCVLFIRGLHPFFSEKYPLEKHPNYPYCGDGNKNLMYDVKTQKHTGQKQHQFDIPENLSSSLYRYAEMSDTREADFQRTMNMRPVERRSVKGHRLHEIKAFDEEFPGAFKQPEERTAEETEVLAAATQDLIYDGMSELSEAQMEAFQKQLFEEYYDIPEIDKDFIHPE